MMGDKTGIEWTEATWQTITAAKRVGVDPNVYVAMRRAGWKRCTKCRAWKHSARFDRDRSRGDGLKASCSECGQSQALGPTKRERRAQGEAWCSGCEVWLNADLVRSGKCRNHRNEQYRRNYAQWLNFCHKQGYNRHLVAAPTSTHLYGMTGDTTRWTAKRQRDYHRAAHSALRSAQ